MKPLDVLAKRDLLAEKNFNRDEVQQYADEFFEQELFGDALELYRKLADRQGLEHVKRKALETGEAELLWRISHYNKELMTSADWEHCGNQAMKNEKYRDAAFAFKRANNDEKRARAEMQFMPAAEEDVSEEPVTAPGDDQPA